MNTMRVFLHDLLWQQDSRGFLQRIRTFLDIAARRVRTPCNRRQFGSMTCSTRTVALTAAVRSKSCNR
jgi:hypothetical protein